MILIALGLGRLRMPHVAPKQMLTAGTAKAELGLVRERQRLSLGK